MILLRVVGDVLKDAGVIFTDENRQRRKLGVVQGAGVGGVRIDSRDVRERPGRGAAVHRQLRAHTAPARAPTRAESKRLQPAAPRARAPSPTAPPGLTRGATGEGSASSVGASR